MAFIRLIVALELIPQGYSCGHIMAHPVVVVDASCSTEAKGNGQIEYIGIKCTNRGHVMVSIDSAPAKLSDGFLSKLFGQARGD